MYLGESIGLSCVSRFIHGFFSLELFGSALKYFWNTVFDVCSSLTKLVITSSADHSHQLFHSFSSQESVSSQ
jgi:hypothetical protein